MAYADGSNPSARKGIGVRLPSSAPNSPQPRNTSTAAPVTEGPLPLTASHSHLFRGTRLSVERARATLQPGPVRVAFSDGVEVSAERLAAGDALLLSVPSYRTSAGAVLDAALWPITQVDESSDAELVTLRLGARIV